MNVTARMNDDEHFTYPPSSGGYAALAERLTRERDEARARAGELADALEDAIGWIEPSFGGKHHADRYRKTLRAFRESEVVGDAS